MTWRVAFAHNFHDRDWLGGRNYFASLFKAIELAAKPDMEWLFVTGRDTETTLPSEFPWLETIRSPLLDRLSPSWFARQATLRTLGTDPLLARYLRKLGVDLLSHAGPLAPNGPVKCLPWLYDFQFMHLPEYWEPKHIRWAEKRYRSACRYANGLLLSSKDAVDDLSQFAPWCVLPTHVLRFVSNPVDFSRLPAREEILRKYQLPDRYFHLPNQFWTNKNHRLVIDALAHLRSQGHDVTVACSGKEFDGRRPEYFAELMHYRDTAGVSAQFRTLGVVPYADLQGLMAYSCAVINPSKFEGWSTTVEEAKTLQRRLLLSDIPVHREQSPRLGRFFGVEDSTRLAQLLAEAEAEGPLPFVADDIEHDYRERLDAFGQTFLSIVRQTLSP